MNLKWKTKIDLGQICHPLLYIVYMVCGVWCTACTPYMCPTHRILWSPNNSVKIHIEFYSDYVTYSIRLAHSDFSFIFPSVVRRKTILVASSIRNRTPIYSRLLASNECNCTLIRVYHMSVARPSRNKTSKNGWMKWK